MDLPNIILITIDSLRADAVGFCDDDPKECLTPNLDKLAHSSITFTTAISQGPYTTISVPSFLTGQYPNRLPVTRDKLHGHIIPRGDSKLAKLLRDIGYNTAAFHSNPLLSSIFGYDEGFVTFYDDLFLSRTTLSQPMKWAMNRARRQFRPRPYLAAAGLNRKVIEWLDTASRPLFLWIHYMDTHGPYQVHGRFDFSRRFSSELLWRKAQQRPHGLTAAERRKLKERYFGEVKYLDQQLASLLRYLSSSGVLENAILAVTADHGEGFYEHGFYSHPHELYEELIRVPLIISVPETQPRVVDEPIGLVSLTPTILDYAGVGEKDRFAGESLRCLIENGDRSCLPEFIISEAELDPYIGSIRTRDWKYILNEKQDKKELYNLNNDPVERNSVIAQYPKKASELERILKTHMAKSVSKGDWNEPPMVSGGRVNDEVVESRLRSLGYI